jgi:hypothetical protein
MDDLHTQRFFISHLKPFLTQALAQITQGLTQRGSGEEKWMLKEVFVPW